MMDILKIVNNAILVLFIISYTYQLLFLPISVAARIAQGILGKRRKKTDNVPKLKYAVLICARNEEKVIGELLDSIAGQTYPAELITAFVIADNCSDATANAAHAHGAVVYERHNTKLVGKGYALEELLAHIDQDYGDVFDGYIVFDADNLLMPDYMERMNEAFAGGSCEIMTSYRNTKNYGDNWLSAGYGLNFLRETRYLNYPRSLLGTSCFVSGTGFLFSRKVKNKIGGWPFHMLIEDVEFTTAQILDGEQIGFCGEAEFYDEQPVKFIQSWNQRLRWSKGYLQIYRHYGVRLLGGMLRGNFACYDMIMSSLPGMLLSIIGVAVNLSIAIVAALNGDNIMIGVQSLANNFVCAYLAIFALGVTATITEWNHIRASSYQKLFYTLTYPLFIFTYIPITFVAFFARVTWKPIEHSCVGRARKLLSPYEN